MYLAKHEGYTFSEDTLCFFFSAKKLRDIVNYPMCANVEEDPKAGSLHKLLQ